ncbi:hypothetical protein C0J52_13678 [Blattella germanica]|nr:hypothetical protein C0J52_13678 [Blattella germanica]
MIARGLLFCLTILLMSLSCSISKKNYTIKPRVVLPENYVKEVRPPSPKGEPVTIEFSIYIVDINSINVEDMDFRTVLLLSKASVFLCYTLLTSDIGYSENTNIILSSELSLLVGGGDDDDDDDDGGGVSVDMFIRQRWIEPRLDMPDDIFEEGDDYVTLPPEFFDNLWQPDPYILNSKVSEIARLTHKFSSVTLYRNKTVRYAARMHAILACQMEFQLYPMDIQSCPMFIESSNFSRLVMYFRFERQIGHHLIQTFAPSTLVVMLSWFSFWIGLDAIPGRVTLLVTSMLTLVTMFTGLKSDIPPVAYVKALDLWMAGCMVFVFAALGEFAVVKVLDVRYQLQKNAKVASIPRILPMRIQAVDNKTHCVTAWDVETPGIRCRKPSLSLKNRRFLQLAWLDHKTGEEKILWKEIDRQSRIYFPAFFLLFVVFYWPILLLKKTG